MRRFAVLAAIFATVCAFGFQGIPGPKELTAKNCIIVEADTGREVWSRNPDTRTYPASTTKMMTLLLLLENTFPTDRITAMPGVDKIKGSSLHLKPFETMTSEDLAYGLMLRSANDACETVATHISGSVVGFVQKMNERAKLIGCTKTTFNNPHGMPDKLHMTTARDLSLIAREGMKNPTFRTIVGTASYVVRRSINQKDTLIKSRNELLLKDFTMKGIKTGFTNDAGRCFVGYRVVNGINLITVIMGCKDWEKDQIALNAWFDENFERKTVLEVGPKFETPVSGGWNPIVKGMPKEMVEAVVPKNAAEPTTTFTAVKELAAPVKVGDRIGEIIVKVENGKAIRVPVFATESVEAKPPFVALLVSPYTFGALGALIIAAGVFAFKLRKPKENGMLWN